MLMFQQPFLIFVLIQVMIMADAPIDATGVVAVIFIIMIVTIIIIGIIIVAIIIIILGRCG